MRKHWILDSRERVCVLVCRETNCVRRLHARIVDIRLHACDQTRIGGHQDPCLDYLSLLVAATGSQAGGDHLQLNGRGRQRKARLLQVAWSLIRRNFPRVRRSNLIEHRHAAGCDSRGGRDPMQGQLAHYEPAVIAR